MGYVCDPITFTNEIGNDCDPSLGPGAPTVIEQAVRAFARQQNTGSGDSLSQWANKNSGMIAAAAASFGVLMLFARAGR